jgi:hypothetical protein
VLGALLVEGVFSAQRGFLNTSTALGDENLETVARCVKEALAAVAEEIG